MHALQEISSWPKHSEISANDDEIFSLGVKFVGFYRRFAVAAKNLAAREIFAIFMFECWMGNKD